MAINNGQPSIIQLQRGTERKQVLFTPDIIPANRYLLGYGPREPYGQDSTVVDYIVPGSPAEEGGLLPGDRVIRLDGEKVMTKKEVSAYLQQRRTNHQGHRFKEWAELVLTMTPRLRRGPFT